MNAFLILNNKKAINLARVSNIIFDPKKLKIIFQFANSINILGKETSDFYELEIPNEEAFEKVSKNLLEHPYIAANFLLPKYIKEDKFYEIVNINHINSITLDEPNKIIFNLDYAIDIYDKKTNKNKKISKFVYWIYENEEAKQKELQRIINIDNKKGE
jgi:hypothetical protein